MSPRRVASAAALILVTAAGCGPGEPWSAREEVRVPLLGPDAPPVRVAAVDVDSHGRMHVLLPDDGEVRVYSPGGELAGTYGEPGTGPGQISPGAGALLVLPGDTVLIPDFEAGRIARFGPGGHHVDDLELPADAGIPFDWQKGADGHLIQQAVFAPPLYLMFHREPVNLLLRRTARGELVDTLAELPNHGINARIGRSADTVRVLAPEPVWTVTGDGRIVIGTTSRYRLQVHEPDGAPTAVIERRVQRPRWSDADRSEVRRRLADVWAATEGLPGPIAEHRAAAVIFEERYPAFAELLGGPEGTIWVRSVETVSAIQRRGNTFDLAGIGGSRWDVFDPDGEYIGVVRMPRSFHPTAVRGHHIYGVITEGGQPRYVSRFRVEPGR